MVGLCVALFLSASPSWDDPKQIITRMEAAYAGFKSYRDSGEGEAVYASGDKETDRERLTFSTAFQRPGKLRFEYEAPWGVGKDRKPSWAMVLSSKGEKEVFRFRVGLTGTPDQVKTYVANSFHRENGVIKSGGTLPLDLAISGMVGLSWGTSCIVTTMLMPDDLKYLRFSSMPDLEMLGEETIEGRPCFKLRSTRTAFKTKTTFWVDKVLLLLRKTHEVSILAPPIIVTKTIMFRPEANVKVPDERFQQPKR